LIPFAIFLGFIYLSFRLTAFPSLFNNQADGFAYYLPLRSFYFDGDFRFADENSYFESLTGCLPYDWRHVTETGHSVYHYSVGPSFLWLPFAKLFSTEYRVAPHLLLESKQLNRPPPIGFFGSSFKSLVLGTYFYGIVGLILIYLFLKQVTKGSGYLYWLTVVLIFGATPFVYYFLYQPLMPHVMSAFSNSLFLYFWSRRIASKRNLDWFLAGLILGLAALIKWPNFLLVFFLMIELIFDVKDKRTGFVHGAAAFLLCMVGFLITFSPQLIFWKQVYRRILVIPQGAGFFSLKITNFFKFLFSWHHGLFSWHPLFLLAIIGYLISIFKKKDIRLAGSNKILLWSSVLTLAAAAMISGLNIDWHGSDSFGARRMVDFSPLFALGLFWFLRRFRKKLTYVFPILVVLIVYNLLFAIQYAQWKLGHFGPVSPVQVIQNTLKNM